MIDDTTGQEPEARPLRSSFDRYLQDKGKGRGGEGGNYRRNAARELERFVEWAAADSDSSPSKLTVRLTSGTGYASKTQIQALLEGLVDPRCDRLKLKRIVLNRKNT
jgi:hypothetical protein